MDISKCIYKAGNETERFFCVTAHLQQHKAHHKNHSLHKSHHNLSQVLLQGHLSTLYLGVALEW